MGIEPIRLPNPKNDPQTQGRGFLPDPDWICKWLIGTGVICFHFGNTTTYKRLARELYMLDLLSHCTYSEPIHLVSFYCVIYLFINLHLFEQPFGCLFVICTNGKENWMQGCDQTENCNNHCHWWSLVSSMLNMLLAVGMMRIPLDPINPALALVLDPTLVLKDLALWNR